MYVLSSGMEKIIFNPLLMHGGRIKFESTGKSNFGFQSSESAKPGTEFYNE